MTEVAAKDKIVVEGLDLECIIGLYDHERETPQRLVVDVELSVDTLPAALSERLEHTVDYEWVSHQIVFILKMGRFLLLEAAAHLICQTLLLPPVAGERRGAISAVELKVRKPLALGGKGQPTLHVTRRAEDASYRREVKPFGTVDVIGETREAGFYRLNVAEGRGIDLHVHEHLNEAEFVLSHGLLCQGIPAARSSVRVWPLGLAHRYDNPTDEVQSILCVDRPPFIESDERSVIGSPGAITAVGAWDL
ncbi:MAG: dihydroneopterin aldolase [Polyangiaceae bacterium]